jgi:hypothetical protein
VGHNGSRAYEGEVTQSCTANNSCVCAHSYSVPDLRRRVGVTPYYSTARIYYIRKHTTRSEENVVAQSDALVQAYIVLDFTIRSRSYARRDERVLAQRCTCAEPCVFHHMAKMPNLDSFSKLSSLINDGTFVYEGVPEMRDFGCEVCGRFLRAIF